ncbi:MAG TPA: alanine racemase [Bacteroidota bacterium]|nr:alanine racemase [Bacteroidota bacterium]
MRPTRAEIDLKALQFNYEGIRKKVGKNIKVMGIVKANAYGHGIIDISQALIRFGTEFLGTALLEEGIFLRKHGISVPILILGGVGESHLQQVQAYNLDVNVPSFQSARRIDEALESIDRDARIRVHLEIDTGMSRTGASIHEAQRFVEESVRLKHLEVVGVFSHFATSDEKDKSFAYQQLEQFDTLIRKLRGNGIEIPLVHIANSGAILDMKDSYYSMVRPGIMLYGIYPSETTSESIPLKPVLSLKSNVSFLKTVPAGTSISYGRTHFTASTTTIATIPIGYVDGYSRRLSHQAEVLIRGRRYPVVGTICMDHLMVDVGMDSAISLGDSVVLIGEDQNEAITVEELSKKLGTVTYEILTGISARIPRITIQ